MRREPTAPKTSNPSSLTEREPLYTGIVKGRDSDYMIVEIRPDVLGGPCLTITDIGPRADIEAAYVERFGQPFRWPEPMLKVVKKP